MWLSQLLKMSQGWFDCKYRMIFMWGERRSRWRCRDPPVLRCLHLDAQAAVKTQWGSLSNPEIWQAACGTSVWAGKSSVPMGFSLLSSLYRLFQSLFWFVREQHWREELELLLAVAEPGRHWWWWYDCVKPCQEAGPLSAKSYPKCKGNWRGGRQGSAAMQEEGCQVQCDGEYFWKDAASFSPLGLPMVCSVLSLLSGSLQQCVF